MSVQSDLQAAPRSSFLRLLLFAVVGGAGTFPVLVALAPYWGYENTVAAYLLGLATLYPLLMAGPPRARLGSSLLVGLFAAPLSLLQPGLWLSACSTLVLLAVVRSALLAPRRLMRAAWQESALGLISLIALGLAGDFTAVGLTLSVWCFWLVQAAFPLLLGTEEAASGNLPLDAEAADDPFERAQAAMLDLLDRA